jgi:hypothetical protein
MPVSGLCFVGGVAEKLSLDFLFLLYQDKTKIRNHINSLIFGTNYNSETINQKTYTL